MPGALKRAEKLEQEAASLVRDAREILDREEQEGRDLSDDEWERWNELHADAEEKQGRAEKLRKQHEAESRLEETPEPKSGRPDPTGDQPASREEKDAGPEYRDIFWQTIREGVSSLPPEQRQVMERRTANLNLDDAAAQGLSDEARALTTGTGSSGGFTVPEDFSDTLTEAEKRFGGMREVSTIINTDNGRPLPWPTNDDTGNKGSLLSENSQVSETDVSFSEVQFDAWTYSSDLIRVPRQLLQDSAFDLENWLPMKLGERIGRIVNEHFTTGSGSSRPNGMVTASTKGADAANAAAYEYDDYVNLEAAVDPAYLENGMWMLSQVGLRETKKIKDGAGNPIWNDGMEGRAPQSILGYPYVVNQDVADPGSGNKSLLMGDMSLYHIRDVQDVQVLILRERYADFLQVGFLAFARRDGDLIDAGTNPVQHLLHP